MQTRPLTGQILQTAASAGYDLSALSDRLQADVPPASAPTGTPSPETASAPA